MSGSLAKWVVMWNVPPDTDIEAWESWYWEQHVPLAKRLPGQLRYTTTKVQRTAYGPSLYRIAEQYFPSIAALEAAVDSPIGRAVAEDATPFVVDLGLHVTLEDEVPLD